MSPSGFAPANIQFGELFSSVHKGKNYGKRPKRFRVRSVSSESYPGFIPAWALFRLSQNFKFFYSLSITSIFGRMHGALNVGKKK